eukprot:7785293-Prorocentrum_lima.AAC.1
MWRKKPSGTGCEVHCSNWCEVGAIIDRVRSKIGDKGLSFSSGTTTRTFQSCFEQALHVWVQVFTGAAASGSRTH